MTNVGVDPVMAFSERESNAHLILDVARLGYVRDEWMILDVTYGSGTFWNLYRPPFLTACDLVEERSPVGYSIDFTALPFKDRSFDGVVFDPPYKLNGTPDPEVDERYGVHIATRWQDRMDLIRRGIPECARVLGDGYLLLKCADQVCSGKVRWQTFEFTKVAERCGLGLVDRLDMLSYRAQPEGTSQIHARRNASSLLVFKRGWSSSDVVEQADAPAV